MDIGILQYHAICEKLTSGSGADFSEADFSSVKEQREQEMPKPKRPSYGGA